MRPENERKKLSVLYIFGGEKAQGAEIVIERLMAYDAHMRNTHLLLSPGEYADELLSVQKTYKLTTFDDLRKLNRMFTGKLRFYSRAAANYFKISYKVRQYIRQHDIDVVHCNTLVPAAYIAPLVVWSRLFMPRVKWIWSDHDMRYFTRMENLLATSCFKLYDRTLLVSAALKSKYDAGSPKLQVLYNGLDPNEFKPDSLLRNNFRSIHGFGNHELIIAIAGSINPDKGQLELIEIFKKLNTQQVNIKLIIAGNFASQFPEYITAIEQALSGEPNIVNIGFIKDTAALYNGCDIIVNNSNNNRSESLGTTIYEAMACEKVVIASATGGTPEIITDNIDGLLFATANKTELFNRLVYAIEKFNSLNDVRKAAREKVLRRFNIKTMSAEYDRIINSL